jgi:prepilin-type N-terminal cleavage/methylation domain-containing protein
MKRIKNGVTLMELLVVLVIIGILSTISVGIYTQQIERARITAAKDMIYQLDVAVTTYQIDVGTLPPSGSGTAIAPSAPNPSSPAVGSGYLQLALGHSLNGDALNPLDYRWIGPYVEIDINKLGDINGNVLTGGLSQAAVNILDPWRTPYYYVNSDDYASFGGTARASTDPYRNTETYYNPSTFQIFSFGPNRRTLGVPNRGTETDDVNNWGYTLALEL